MQVSTESSAGLLQEVPLLLRSQWARFVDSGAIVLRWLVQPDERRWVETFLQGPMDGASRAFLIEGSAEPLDGHGYRVGRALIPALAKVPLGTRCSWTCPRIPSGMSDVDVLTLLLFSFARHTCGTWLRRTVIVFTTECAPRHAAAENLWIRWVYALSRLLQGHASSLRVVVLDDAKHPLYGALGREHSRMVHTMVANLELDDRIVKLVDTTADPKRHEGRLRSLLVHTLRFVNQGRVDDAELHAMEIEALVGENGPHCAVIPVRFAVAGGRLAEGRPVDAVRSYRAAESAAEHAELAGEACSLRLRIVARFGVSAALLATPHGAASAASYYEETAPLCRRTNDGCLELEAYRCSSVAYELAADRWSGWRSAMSALRIFDRLTREERPRVMMVSLVDSILRLTESRELQHHRASVEGELRKRALRGSVWT